MITNEEHDQILRAVSYTAAVLKCLVGDDEAFKKENAPLKDSNAAKEGIKKLEAALNILVNK